MRTINLWVKDGYLSTPDGNSIYFWGFAASPDAPAQVPGPHLVVNQGEDVTVNLVNQTGAEPVSIFFNGQRGVRTEAGPVRPQYDAQGRLVSFVDHAEPGGGTISYSFRAERPGTYLYESGTNPHKQILMGLYGVLVVRPLDFDRSVPGLKTAYGAGSGTEFDREYVLVTGEIDPVLNAAAERGQPYRISKFRPRYWTLNGRCAPDTMLGDSLPHLPHQPYGAMVMAQPGERVLIRLAGAGIDNHPLHPHGNYSRVVAIDGSLLRNGVGDRSYHKFTVLLGAGQTCDLIFRWTGLGYTPANPVPVPLPNRRNMGVGDLGFTMWSGSPYLGVKGDIPVGVVSFNEMGEYNFMLHAHEEQKITNWGEFPGGLMTMIAIYPSLPPEAGSLS
ncbi:MAG TPA: multicopper oxidase domain-containing protein [Firmicutes bacterium]|nr:multicopper oxidase domain-containing protein [Candidatus Fermentithermobacillaceae bacterium]